MFCIILCNAPLKSLKNDDIKINPSAIAPPIFKVFTRPSTNPGTSPYRQDSIARYIVLPGTEGINPDIKNIVAGERKMYAAVSEYRAMDTPHTK